MTTWAPGTAVRKAITVACPVARAFAVFTEDDAYDAGWEPVLAAYAHAAAA